MAFDEVIDDLQNGYFIRQRTDGFKFGMDAVLLADFAKSVSGRVMDLCTGTGIIPILLAAKSEAEEICGVELQPEFADMARRSAAENGLEGRLSIACADLKDAPALFGRGGFDCVTVNPPYMKAGAGLTNGEDMKTIARHEVKCTLDDVLESAAALLKPLGRFYMVHRPARLADIICGMRGAGIEPKLMRLVSPAADKAPKLVLIHGVKGAKSELKLLPQLVLYNSDGSIAKEVDEIYGR